MGFFDGLLVGASSALLIAGVVQWFSDRLSQQARERPRIGNGTLIRAERSVLNGVGLICLTSQAAITLFVGAIMSEATKIHDDLVLVIVWLVCSLMLGGVFAILGTRSETTFRE